MMLFLLLVPALVFAEMGKGPVNVFDKTTDKVPVLQFKSGQSFYSGRKKEGDWCDFSLNASIPAPSNPPAD